VALHGGTGEPAVLQLVVLPHVGAAAAVERPRHALVVHAVDGVAAHGERGVGGERMRPQRAAAGTVDRAEVAVVGGTVQRAAIEQDRAVGVVETLDVGAALAVGELLLPQLLAVVLAQRDQLAVVGADEHHAVGGQRHAVAAQAERRHIALVVGPAALAGGGVEAVHATVLGAHDHQVAADRRRGDHFGNQVGLPARAAVLRAHGVDVAVERAHRKQIAGHGRAAGIRGIDALRVAQAEPALAAAGGLFPQLLAAGGVERGDLAVGTVGIQHAVHHGRAQAHAADAGAVTDARGPHLADLHR